MQNKYCGKMLLKQMNDLTYSFRFKSKGGKVYTYIDSERDLVEVL
jgi:hypothetical protein